jgi:hypothetical protein
MVANGRDATALIDRQGGHDMGRHPLEVSFNLTATELLDAILARKRLRVALAGAVAEFEMHKHVERLDSSIVERSEAHDLDGYPDFSIYLRGRDKPILAECKNARNESYTKDGKITAYRVELQKTRASKGDPTSRYYSVDLFQILGVCLGTPTRDWTQFMFVRTADLPRHAQHPNKLEVMHRVPVSGGPLGPWSPDLGEIVRRIYDEANLQDPTG